MLNFLYAMVPNWYCSEWKTYQSVEKPITLIYTKNKNLDLGCMNIPILKWKKHNQNLSLEGLTHWMWDFFSCLEYTGNFNKITKCWDNRLHLDGPWLVQTWPPWASFRKGLSYFVNIMTFQNFRTKLITWKVKAMYQGGIEKTVLDKFPIVTLQHKTLTSVHFFVVSKKS